MPQSTLDERFKDGPPSRGAEERRRWLTAEERRFVLWGFKEKWPATRIGGAIGVSEATVRRFRRQYFLEPNLLLELGLQEMVGKAREQEYRCLICSERILTRLETERHVLRHYLDQVIVDRALPPAKETVSEHEQDPHDD